MLSAKTRLSGLRIASPSTTGTSTSSAIDGIVYRMPPTDSRIERATFDRLAA